MITIKDIARISGYSTGTVSRVLNNKADVSEEARAAIEAVIRDQNYQPNANAKKLRQTTQSGIHILVRGMNNSFLASLLEEILFRMREHSEGVSVQFLDETESEIDAARQLCISSRPKGIIFLGGSTGTFRESFGWMEIPCVLVTADASSLGYRNLSSFTTDDSAAASYAVSRLIEAGHRRVGIIGGYPVMYPDDNSTKRIGGAAGALERAGIQFDMDKDYEPCPFSMQGGYDAAAKLLDRCPDITAIFALSDAIAYGSMRLMRDRGMDIPSDMSVVGFDGLDYSQFMSPRLSTVRQDISGLAAKSVDDMLLRINYQRAASHGTVPFKFIDGESISSPKL